MKKEDWAGAGVMLFFWMLAFVVPPFFAQGPGPSWTDFLSMALIFVGIWAGYQTRRELKAERAKSDASGTPVPRADP